MDRKRGTWRSLAAAAALAACVDGPTAPGRFGELRIRPTYDAGDEPGALGVNVDSAVVRVTRRGEPDTPLLDARVAYPSDTTSLAWILDLRETAESLAVSVTLWGGGTRFYDGGDTVEVRDAVLAAAAAPVDVGYVGPAIVAAVTVTPGTDTLEAFGATTALVAVARDRHDAIVPGVAFSWTSGAGAVASVDPNGVVSAAGNGTATITATTGTTSGDATVVVRQRVADIAITPGDLTLTAVGATQTLGAQPRDANGFPVAEAGVTWSSGAPGVASVDPVSGLVTAVAGGTATITATSGTVTASATVTVNPIADVASIVVSPSSATLTAAGATRQFEAVALDAGGAELSGVQFTWASSHTGVATVDAAGLARAAGHGTTQITAGAGAITGAATLTVDLSTTIVSVSVSPTTATLTGVGATQPFTATALDAGGAEVLVAGFVWSSAVPGVATVDAATGVATAVSHGATTITAAVAGVAGTAALTVDLTSTVTSVAVAPATATLTAVGAMQAFTATAHDAGGADVPGVPFVWTSGTPAVAGVDAATGVATAVSHGATTIIATTGGVSGSATLSVDLAPTVATVTVAPAAATLTALGATQQFTAKAHDTGGLEVPGVTFMWTSGTVAVATIDAASGLATAAGHGTTTISATAGGVSGTANLNVNLAVVIASVTVSPPAATLGAVGATQQFTAVARDADGSVVPVVQFAWSSSAPAIATVDPPTGLATAVSHGTTTVTAAVAGVAGSAALTVDLTATIATITVTPSDVTLQALGATQQFTAEARDAAGNVVPGVPVTWSSSDPGFAVIDPVTGVATALANGTAIITAAAGSVSGTAALTVSQEIVTVVVTPDTVILVGSFAPQQYSAQAFDANGHLVPNVTFSWETNDPVVATVDATGLVTPLVLGYAKIKATAGGVTGFGWLFVE